jgi:hypothetical protein
VYRAHALAKLVDSFLHQAFPRSEEAFFRASALNARGAQAAGSRYPGCF